MILLTRSDTECILGTKNEESEIIFHVVNGIQKVITNFLSCQNTTHKYDAICISETYFDKYCRYFINDDNNHCATIPTISPY